MTIPEARNALLALMKEILEPLSFPIVWPDIPAKPPSTESPYIRITINHVNGFQSSLADETGKRIWSRGGNLVIQIYVPIGQSLKEGAQTEYDTAQLIISGIQAFRHPALWFRNTRLREIGIFGAFNQINVLTEFNYDDQR